MRIGIIMSVIRKRGKRMSLSNCRFPILKEYKGCVKAIILLMFLLHWPKFNASIIGIDTESIIWDEKGLYKGWLITGRQGLVMLKYLFGNASFNPWFSAMLTMLTFPLAVIGFYLLWDKAGGRKNSIVVWLVGSLLWISHPVVTEQLYFSLQSFEISLGILLTAAALYLTFVWTENLHRLWSFLLSVCLLLLTFSIYQAFVPLYIFGAVSVLLLQALRMLSEGEQKLFSKMASRMSACFLTFIIAFITNTIVTRLFFNESDYLTNQIQWGTLSFSEVFWRIIEHIKSVLLGRILFYSIFYGLLLFCSLILLAVYLWKFHRSNLKGCITVCFFYVSLQITPFLMTILQGGEPAFRSQLVLPAMTGFQAILSMWLLKELDISRNRVRQVLLVCIMILGFLGGIHTAKTTWSLYYTDQLRYEQDVALGRSLIDRIEQVCSREDIEILPVVVIGRRPFRVNNSCVQGQVMGYSLFDWDITSEPIPYFSTRRVLGFLHTLGADYRLTSAGRMEEALAISKYMPEWPAEGCVQIQDGMIIVKLSDL